MATRWPTTSERSKRTRYIPIIFLTAAANDLDHIYRAYSVGAVDYLIKPLDAHAVSAKVSVFVQLYRQRREIERQAKILVEKDRREHALRLAELRVASDKRYRALVEGIDHAIAWSAEPETLRFSFMSRQAERILGYSTAQYSAPNFWFERVHPDDRERCMAVFHAALETGRDQVCDHRFVTAHGEVLWLHTVMRVERDIGGLHPELHGLSVDITELKNAERTQQFLADASRALSESLEPDATLSKLARLVVPFIADLCVIDALDGDVVAPVAIAHAEAAKEPLLKAIGKRSLSAATGHRGLAEVFRSGEAELHAEVDDPARLAEALAIPDELARSLGATAFMLVPLRARDRVVAVATLVAASPARTFGFSDLTLAQDIATRSALASENGRLYEEARRAIQAREDVLMVVSHDLRNPLNVVTMSAERIERAASTAKGLDTAKSMARTIHRAALGMDRLLGDLQDLERMRQGRLAIEAHPEDVQGLLATALEMLSPLAEEKAIHVEVDAEGLSGVKILCDRQRIGQVFFNLFGNAVKFSPQGSRIVLRAASDDAHVRFSVADQGPGIEPEHLPHVFDRFWQAKRRGRWGLGLGLAITKGIVEAHDGRLWVESEVARGTRFHFTLPRVSAAEPGVRLTA